METKRNELEKFNHSVGVLVKALFDDTLVHGNCFACAVGNLVAAACNFTFKPSSTRSKKIKWSHIPNDGYYEGGSDNNWYEVVVDKLTPNNNALLQIQSTGYTIAELERIENAFEGANHGQDDTEYMFNGLMAVVDVLADIHGVDLSVKESAKLQFVKA
jgi:hypothetical protein